MTSGVAWRPVSNIGPAKSGVDSQRWPNWMCWQNGGESKIWMLRQQVTKSKACLSIQFLIRGFCKD